MNWRIHLSEWEFPILSKWCTLMTPCSSKFKEALILECLIWRNPVHQFDLMSLFIITVQQRLWVWCERLPWHAHIAIFTAYVAFATFVRFILFLLMRVTWGLFKPAMSSSSLGRDLVSQLLSSAPLGNLKQRASGKSVMLPRTKMLYFWFTLNSI